MNVGEGNLHIKGNVLHLFNESIDCPMCFNLPMAHHSSVIRRFKSWLNSSNCVARNHVRICIPVMIGWYSWLARNDAKHNGKKITASSIIIKVMNNLYLIQAALPMSRDFWRVNHSIAALWSICLPAAPVLRVRQVVWQKAPRHWVKINSDGAYNHRTTLAGVGG